MKSFLLLTILLPLIWAYDFRSFYDSKRFYVPYQLELDTFSGYQAEFMERYLRNSSEYISFRPRTEQENSYVSIYGANECINVVKDQVCNQWKQSGYCTKYKGYMQTYCKKSCDFCKNFRFSQFNQETCRNTIADKECEFMKTMDFCTTKPSEMKQMCAKTCHFCTSPLYKYEKYFSKFFCQDYKHKYNCFEVFFKRMNGISYFPSKCQDKDPKCVEYVNKCKISKEVAEFCPRTCGLCYA